MNFREPNGFEIELDEARKKLRALGKDAADMGSGADYCGIQNNFVMPYSSLPELVGSRWKTAEFVDR